jgi:DNA polymerase-1
MTPDHHKKIFLLDAMALVYRAYFAFSSNPRITSKGLNTSAIFGFTNTLLEVLQKEKPTHMAIVFDTHAPTVRHEIHTDYKANRAETPEDIITAVPYIIRVAEAFRIPVLMKDGYEADDIIGTLAKEAEKHDFKVYMMTSDKDYGQLVSDHVFIYKPSNKGKPPEVLGVKEVCAKFGIQEPKQVIDILGLMGDAVDNIKGVPGVGEKTAMQLIKDFHSVEGVLQNTDKLKGKLKEKVEQNVELAKQSKLLATIITDVPLEYNLDSMALQTPDKQAMLEVMSELEFKTIAVRVMKDFFPGESPAVAQSSAAEEPKKESKSEAAEAPVTEEQESVSAIPTDIKSTPHKYEQVAESAIDELVKKIEAHHKLALFMAIQGEGCHGVALSTKEGEAHFISITNDGIWQKLKPLLENPKVAKTGHDIKKSLNFLHKHNITINGTLFDTMIAHFLVRPDASHSISDIATTELSLAISEYGAETRRPAKEQISMDMVSDEQLMQLSCERADVLFRLHDVLDKKMHDIKVDKLCNEVEIPLEKTLSDMEVEGIKVNKDTLKEISGILQKDIESLSKEIQTLAGQEFNIDSPRQVGEILFDKLKISDKVKKTKTGQYSTSEETLAELAGENPIVDKILSYREMQKLKNTYVDSLPSLIDPKTGRIHTTFNMVVAVTGRLSSDNPNLQNIPVRTDRGREIRKAFVAGDDSKVLLSADYSQIELRIIASLSGDKAMIEAFNHNYDVHAATAARIYGVDIKAVTPDMRRNAKTVNFGIIYGISGFGLSQRLGIARKEALEIIKQYFTQYPDIKAYMDNNIEFARKNGYVETIMGRRRYLPDINSRNYAVRGFAERNAINAPIQGSAADMIKIAMIHIHDEMQKHHFKSKMILQVHDELVFDAYPEELDKLKPLVESKMKSAIPLNVPIEVNMGTGKNWLEAH